MARETSDSTQNDVRVTLLVIKLGLTGCSSLKDKRSQLRPLLYRIQKEYNASVAETGLQDIWQSAWVSCALVSNDSKFNTQVAQQILLTIEKYHPGLSIEEYSIEYR